MLTQYTCIMHMIMQGREANEMNPSNYEANNRSCLGEGG